MAAADGSEWPGPSCLAQPHSCWCTDYQSEFMVANGPDCPSLEIADFATRCLPSGETPESTPETHAFAVSEQGFTAVGLPQAIGTDDGVPFASRSALCVPMKLTVWFRPPDSAHHTGTPRTEWPS
jgi:putative transposase